MAPGDQNTPAQVREKLIARLRDEGRNDLAARLSKCGQPLRLMCPDCYRPRDVLTRCDLKWCPSCQRALAARAAARFTAIAKDCQWPLFATWTVQHSRDDPPSLIREVRRGHTKLRRLQWWRRCVRGGVVAFEVTKGDHGWHPHAHSLIDCRWLHVSESAPRIGATREEWAAKGKRAAKECGEQWSLCVERRGGVKVRRCWSDASGGIGGAVAEVLKYSVKGSDLVTMADDIGPLIDVLDRTRLLASWGTFYRHPAIKRARSAPAMCACGCSNWLPESVCENRELRESRRARRR